MKNLNYIKTPGEFKGEYSLNNEAPRFRREFFVKKNFKNATVMYTGLGYGYFYFNGQRVTEDRFTAPVSDYRKTVWYMEYDVTSLIHEGENVVAAILGNGFYNESFHSAWDNCLAAWRDKPKLLFKLTLNYDDGSEVIISDETWKCTNESPIVFNLLRSGEYYDARLYEKGWNDVGFNDSAWENAIIDTTPPKGTLRKCDCEPIRECEEYLPVSIVKNGDNRYVFELSQNISGYIALKTGYLTAGQHIKIRYAECLNEDKTLNFMGSDGEHFYPESRYAWDEFTADGEDFVWSPRFAYHGFRYIEIEGLTNKPADDMVKGVFVHQDVKRIADFSCSNDILNRIYKMGIYATWSNLFYMPTDCPSREKFGWANDAQSSMEQFLIDFDMKKLLKKWFVDILDSMRDKGEIPGIIPSHDWGFEWGTGPTSSGVLFELPAMLYHYTGDSSLLIKGLPAFLKHLSYIISNTDKNGLINYGLSDWSGPWDNAAASPTPVECSNMFLYVKFLRITELAARLARDEDTEKELLREEIRVKELILETYFNEDGTMNVPEQCALSMAIMLDVYPDFSVIKKQLEDVMKKDNYRINCGMLGLRYLYHALDKIGRSDIAYIAITAEGYPGYVSWITDRDATTLCETWNFDSSQNHQMFSDVLAWMIKTIGGIRITEAGCKKCIINPYFPSELTWCKVHQDTINGSISVDWTRINDDILLKIDISGEVKAFYMDRPLKNGMNEFVVSRGDL